MEDYALDLGFECPGKQTFLARRRFEWPYEVGMISHKPRTSIGRLTIQSGASNMIAGDRLRQRYTLGMGARIRITGQGAMPINRTVNGVGASESVEIHLAETARLEFIQEPRILFSGADYRQFTSVHMGDCSELILVDSVIRHPAPGPASYFSEIRLMREGSTLAVERMGFDFSATRSANSAALIVASGNAPNSDWRSWLALHSSPLSYGCVSPLPNAVGVGVRITAADGGRLRDAVDQALSILGADGKHGESVAYAG